MSQTLLAAVLAFLGSSMINIGQAVQKIGLETDGAHKTKRLGIWSLGTLSIVLSTFVTLYAIALSSASLVGAMAGTGLASLTIFSIFVMKEKVGLREIAGVAVLLSGAVLIGAFAAPSSKAAITNLSPLYLFFAVLVGLYFLPILLLRKKKEFIGLLLAAFGGVFGGMTTLFQRVHTSQIQALNQNFFLNPFLYVWIAMAVLSFVVLQFAYKNDKAIRIIPAFSSHFILVPVIGGVLCFGEQLDWQQWGGVILILIGVLLVTLPQKQND